MDDDVRQRITRASERAAEAAERTARAHEAAAEEHERHADVAEALGATVEQTHLAREHAWRIRRAAELDRDVAAKERQIRPGAP